MAAVTPIGPRLGIAPRARPSGCRARRTTAGAGPRGPRRRGAGRLGPWARRNARPCSSSCTRVNGRPSRATRGRPYEASVAA